jgi:hypothetical protein
MVVVEDGVADEARTTLAQLIQKRNEFAPILAPMCLTTVRSLQKIKCAPHGRTSCSMVKPTMGKTSAMNCRTILLLFSSSLCTLTMF